MTNKERITEILKAYTKKHNIMASSVILEEYAEELVKQGVVMPIRCKDCEHCCISIDPKTNISIQKCGYVGFNPMQSSQVSDDFYCGFGELKEREKV